MMLMYGSVGPDVTTLQTRLKRAGYKLIADGIFGQATERALRLYQRGHGLVADGIAGPKTQAALRGKPYNAPLAQADIELAAQTLVVDVPAVLAVNEVESRGVGFIAPRRPAILFERHIMRRQMQAHGAPVAQAERDHPNIVNKQPGGYKGGMAEHIRLIRAQKLCAPAAPESASWGLFQIMGYHWQTLGYDSQYAFADAMSDDEASQLDAFVRFVQADSVIHKALADHDWPGFAAAYNGPNYERNDYDTRLASAYRRHAAAESSTSQKPDKQPSNKRTTNKSRKPKYTSKSKKAS